jgi:hypothetical protein
MGEADADLKGWINQALAEVPSGVTLMQHLGNVRGEVQQLAATWSNSMEELGGACLPRVMRSLKEIELLRVESESLCEMIKQLSENVSSLDMEAVKSLSDLEVIKRRMDSCRTVFEQADKFKAQLSAMDSIYESGDVSKMSSALASLVQSFSNLSNLSEFEGDKALVSRYTERLESLVRPKLIEAFANHDTVQAGACVQTLAQINRLDQVSLLHHKQFNQSVLQLWSTFDSQSLTPSSAAPASQQPPPHSSSSATLSPPSPSPSPLATASSSSNLDAPHLKGKTPQEGIIGPSTLPTWIAQFFKALTPLLQKEVTWIPSLFPDASKTIATLLISCMGQLATPLDRHLRQLGLTDLTTVYLATKSFASGIDHLVQPLGIGLRFQVFQSVFSPYRKYQSQFHHLEAKWLNSSKASFELDSKPQSGPSPASLIHSIDSMAVYTFTQLETSVDHCIALTEGMETESLQKLLTTQLLSFLGWASQQLQVLLPILTQSVGHTAAPTTGQSSSTMPLIAPLISDANEWKEDLFHLALDMLKTAVKIQNLLSKLASTFRDKLLSQKQVLFGEQDLNALYERSVPIVPNLFLYQDQETVLKLAKMFGDLERVEFEIFPSCPKMVDAFISTVQFGLFETMFGYIRQQMGSFSKSAAFGKESSQRDAPAAQSYVKQLVEHFLILPQTMEHVESEHEDATTQTLTFLNTPIKPFEIVGRPKYFGLPSSVLAESESSVEPQGFSVDWMVLIARETQFLLASHILQLPLLSSFGVLQLESDINHLYSVLAVLELKQESILEQILSYCKVPASEFPSLLGQTLDAELKKLLILIGRSRKLLLTSK